MLTTLIILAIAGAGLVGGLLFAFSVCVMSALRDMPGGEGMRAMQLINRKILNPVFLGAFMGTTILCLAVVVMALLQQPDGFLFAVAGAACYLIGGFGITAACNVPRNNLLDQASVDTDEGLALWQRYLREWTMWNHIRTALCVVAVLLLAVSL